MFPVFDLDASIGSLQFAHEAATSSEEDLEANRVPCADRKRLCATYTLQPDAQAAALRSSVRNEHGVNRALAQFGEVALRFETFASQSIERDTGRLSESALTAVMGRSRGGAVTLFVFFRAKFIIDVVQEQPGRV